MPVRALSSIDNVRRRAKRERERKREREGKDEIEREGEGGTNKKTGRKKLYLSNSRSVYRVVAFLCSRCLYLQQP